MFTRFDIRCFEFFVHPREDVVRIGIIFHCLRRCSIQPSRESMNSFSSSCLVTRTKHHLLHSVRRSDWPIQSCPTMDCRPRHRIELCVIVVFAVLLNPCVRFSSLSLDLMASCWTEESPRSHWLNRNSLSSSHTSPHHRGGGSFFDSCDHQRHLNRRYLNWSDQESEEHWSSNWREELMYRMLDFDWNPSLRSDIDQS